MAGGLAPLHRGGPWTTSAEKTAVLWELLQLRTGHWAGSELYLRRTGRRPTPACPECTSVCSLFPVTLCLVCGEEADTPVHVLLRCLCLCGTRLSALGNRYGSPNPPSSGTTLHWRSGIWPSVVFRLRPAW